jgi:hypothetical protein
MWPGGKEVKVTYCQRECRGGKQVKMNSGKVKGNTQMYISDGKEVFLY